MPDLKSRDPVFMDDAMERVKYYIEIFTSNSLEGTGTGEVLRDVTGSAGKMIRPRLLLLCGALGPKASEHRETLCMLAAMVEMTHMASLIHDDIVDEAPYRRGRLSIQKKYGKDAAVYAGDFLISRVHYWQAVKGLNEAAAILSKTVEEMCVGEIGQAMYRYNPEMTTERYLANIQGKTAALFKAACTMGARESGCDSDVLEKLGQLGEYLGLIFQLRDDLMDFLSDDSSMGKKTHKDFSDGIYTLPVLLARQTPEGGKILADLMKQNSKRHLDEDEISLMEETVKMAGGTDATLDYIHHYTSICRDLLASFVDPCPVEKEIMEAEAGAEDGKRYSVEMIRKMLDKFDEI